MFLAKIKYSVSERQEPKRGSRWSYGLIWKSHIVIELQY